MREMLDKVVKDFPELLPTIQEEGRNKITFSLITDLRDFEAVAKRKRSHLLELSPSC